MIDYWKNSGPHRVRTIGDHPSEAWSDVVPTFKGQTNDRLGHSLCISTIRWAEK